MAYGARQSVSLVNPAQWIAVLRIAVGLYFLKSVVTKLHIVMLGGVVPIPMTSERWLSAMPKIVARQASENPVLFYKQFLDDVVLQHSAIFAHLTAWGEVVVGLGLVLGFCTGIAAIVGLFLVTNYGLATQWMSPGQQGFHLMLFVLMVTFFFTRAGRMWGLDAWIARTSSKSRLAQRPIS